MKPTKPTDLVRGTRPECAPQCWVAFFREARRIANQRRLADARNGIRRPSTLKRQAKGNVTDEPQTPDNPELQVL